MPNASSNTDPSRPPAPPPTAQQVAAVETKDVSVVLSAGAGCGKTSVLTQRFLSHLEPGPDSVDLSRLVAITFTERAAREMRERIRSQCLEKLRASAPNDAGHWLDIVRSLDSARISTIHAFCSSLVRSHAVEAAIDPGFGLLDETLSASFLGRSVEAGVHKLLADGNSDIAELVFEFDLSGTIGRLIDLVGQRYRIDFAKWDRTTPEVLAARWEEQWHAEFVPQLLNDLAASPAARKTLELLDQHEPKNSVMQQRRRVLLEQIPLLASSATPEKTLTAIRENAQVKGGGTKKDWTSEDVFAEIRDALTDLRKQIDTVLGQLDYEPEHLRRGAEIGLCALHAARLVGDCYDSDKRTDAVLDFDDLVLHARNLLRDHDDVRRRVATGISLLMVDEFQDTDPLQYEIVQMLCGKQELTGRLFVVGDAKQSIYRFRRAEPRIFHELRERVALRGRLPLTMNFRSQPEILAFVNAVFDGALAGEYEPLVAASPQKTPPPCIEFLFASAGGDDTAEKENTDDRRRREADWIARRVKQLLTDGVPRIRERDKQSRDYKLRNVKARDIVILFRAMTDVRFYEAALREHGLAYYVVGGRAFFAQQEVFDVINLCQHLDNIDDEVALVGVLRSPFFSLSDDALVTLGPAPAQALTADPPAHLSQEQQELVRFAGTVLAELRSKKDRLPIARLLNLAIERTGYDAALLTEFLGARKLANLYKLIDMARQFDQSGLFTLADFVARLRDALADEIHEPLAATHPESSDIIRLMSIHQSKGLEFPVVVVADMDRKVRNQSSSVHFDQDLGPVVSLSAKFGVERDFPARRMLSLTEREQDLAESRRLLYVATTRAADLLILSANLKKPGQPEGPWFQLVAERFDLSTGQPRQTPVAGSIPILPKHSHKLPEIFVHQKPPALVPAAQGASRSASTINLPRFREILEQSLACALPESLRTISPDATARRRFSVSAIEEIDRLLRPGSTSGTGDDRGADRAEYDETELISEEPPANLSSAEKLGTLVHQVLERLDFQKPDQAQALIERCAAAAGRSIDESIRSLAATCISNFLGSPLASELAGARSIHREIDFLLCFPPLSKREQQIAPPLRKGGPGEVALQIFRPPPHVDDRPFTITGTIDCLFESASGGWIVLDYKTGVRDRSTSPAELLAGYEIQLGLYALAIQKYVQRLPDRIELVFIRNGVDRVTFEPTEARLAEITARVAQALAYATRRTP